MYSTNSEIRFSRLVRQRSLSLDGTRIIYSDKNVTMHIVFKTGTLIRLINCHHLLFLLTTEERKSQLSSQQPYFSKNKQEQQWKLV